MTKKSTILKKIRQERGYTARFVYTALGVTQVQYSNYETGKRYPQSVNFFMNLKKFYNFNDSEILKIIQVLESEVKQDGGQN